MHPLKPLNNTNIKSYTSKLYLQKSANFTSLYAYTKTLNKQSKHLTPCHMQKPALEHRTKQRTHKHITIIILQITRYYMQTNIKKKATPFKSINKQ